MSSKNKWLHYFHLSDNWRYKPQSLFLTDTTGQYPAYWDLEHSYRLTMFHVMTHSHWYSSTRLPTTQGPIGNTRNKCKLGRRLAACSMNFWNLTVKKSRFTAGHRRIKRTMQQLSSSRTHPERNIPLSAPSSCASGRHWVLSGTTPGASNRDRDPCSPPPRSQAPTSLGFIDTKFLSRI